MPCSSSTRPRPPTQAELRAALAGCGSEQELVEAALELTGAVGGALAELADGELEILATSGLPTHLVRAWRRFPVDVSPSIAGVVESRRPYLAARSASVDPASAFWLEPLDAGPRVLGVLGLLFPSKARPDAGQRVLRRRTAREVAERLEDILHDLLHDRTERLLAATEAFASAALVEDVLDAIVRQATGALDAVATMIALRDEPTARLGVVRTLGFTEEEVDRFDRLDLNAPVPLAVATRTGELVVLETYDEIAERFPGLASFSAARGTNAFVALPLGAEGRRLGAIGLSFQQPRFFRRSDRGFLEALARLASQTLVRAERARRYDQVIRLQQLASQLSQARTLSDVADVALGAGEHVLDATSGRLALIDPRGRELRLVASFGVPPALVEAESRMPFGRERPLASAAFTGEPVLIEALSEAAAEWPEVEAHLAAVNARSLVALPLSARGRPIGSIAFCFRDERAFGREELGFLAALGDLCAQAVDRAQLFDTVARSRNNLRHLVEHLGEGVLAVDADGLVTIANDEARELLGVDDLVGSAAPDLAGQLSLRDLARGVIQSGEPSDRRISAGEQIVEVLCVPGGDVAVIGLRDVTSRERQERAEREFVANAAHELRTPLAAIANAVEALQLGAKHNPGERDLFLAGLESEVERMTRLVRALLLLARAQASGDRLPRQPVGVASLLAEAAESTDPRAGVRIVIDLPDEEVSVLGDEALISAALLNVARNAARHTSNGSIRFSAQEADEEVTLEVEDTGSGMSTDVRLRAGERFYRGGDRDRAGFGLGLPLAEEMVRVLGGRLAIRSQEGKGTAVRITLPRA